MVTKSIECPSCEARLKVAGTLPAGKKIKCPKCDSAFAVPEDEDEPVEAIAVSPARKRKAAPPPEDDNFDDDEVEERRPRRPRKKPKKAKSNVALFVGLGVGAVVLLTGGVLAVVLLRTKPKDTAVAQTTTPAPAQATSNVQPTSQPNTPPAGVAAATTPPVQGNPGDAAPASGGRKVFDDQNCARCHSLGSGGGGPPGKGKRGQGPDLSRVGANHDAGWIMEHVRDPKSHRPNSRMPAYDARRISDADLRALGDYLAGLK
jgi:mono/diheme cytochrome c family protein